MIIIDDRIIEIKIYTYNDLMLKMYNDILLKKTIIIITVLE